MTNTKPQLNPPGKIQIFFFAVLCIALLLPMLGAQSVSAQTPAPAGWETPINLSNSGAASDPIILVDNENITHVIWFDEYAGYRYSRSEAEGVWSAPTVVIFPFADARPHLLLGPGNLIYAFWIDSRSMLNSSRVFHKNFGNRISWEPRRLLTQNSSAFEVMVDADQIMHLAYLTNADTPLQPAGLYYRQITPGGGWTIDKRITTSLYFRSMQPENAHISIFAAAQPAADDSADAPPEKNVFVAWDEPALGKVVISRSPDGGDTWGEPRGVDMPTSVSGSVTPNDLEVTIWNGQVVLVWKRLLTETSCNILFQVSPDGKSWTVPANVFSEAPGCPTDSGFLAQRDDLLIWQAVINNQVYLAAWDGTRWSQPQAQTELSSFKDPVSERTLSMGCRNIIYQVGLNILHAVGCDLDGNQDIWVTHKTIEDLQNWFPPPSAWSDPRTIAQAPYMIDELHLLADMQGGYHALWSQKTTQNGNSTLYYSGSTGNSWTEPSSILRPRGGHPHQMATSMNAAGDLMIAWRGPDACQMYFSRAPSSRAFSSVEWLATIELPTPTGTCSAPSLAAGVQDTVYAAYAVAINEGRGIYLNRSPDGGRSWDAPVKVFDGEAAGWEMVDNPIITRSGVRLHILWRHGSLLAPGMSQGLGYAYSDDNGLTWSAADTTIVDRLHWAGLTAASEGTLFRVWQQAGAEHPVIVTQFSADGGQSWSAPVSIVTFGDIIGSPRLLADASGGIHLVQMNRDYLNKVVIQHWIWYNQSWAAGEGLEFNSAYGSIMDLSGVVSIQNQVAVLFATNHVDIEGQLLQAVISAAGPNAESPAVLPVAQATSTPAAEVTPDQTAIESTTLSTEPASTAVQAITASTPTQEPGPPVITTSTQAAAVASEEAMPVPAETNSWFGLILGIALAALIVLGVFALRIMQSRA